MKTESNSRSWDDLVFENRNTEYGAYVIRKSYPTHVVEGLFASLLFGGSLYLLSQLSTMFPSANLAKPNDDGGVITLQDPPVFEAPKKMKQRIQDLRRAIPDAIPQVTALPVPEQDVLQNPTDGSTDPNAKGNETPVGEASGTAMVETVSPPVQPQIWDHAEVMPSYEGGMAAMMKFIQKKLRYPAIDQRIGTEGTVFVQFVVNEEGKVVDVKVVKGISATCDKEAARVIGLMPGWIPGMQNKMAVSVRMILPIKFRLEN